MKQCTVCGGDGTQPHMCGGTPTLAPEVPFMGDALKYKKLYEDTLLQIRDITEDRDAWSRKEIVTSNRLVEVLLQLQASNRLNDEMKPLVNALVEYHQIQRAGKEGDFWRAYATLELLVVKYIANRKGEGVAECPALLKCGLKAGHDGGCAEALDDKRSPRPYQHGDDISDDAMHG